MVLANVSHFDVSTAYTLTLDWGKGIVHLAFIMWQQSSRTLDIGLLDCVFCKHDGLVD